MDYDFNNKTTLGKIKLLMLKGEQGKTGHGAYAAYDVAEMTDKQQIYVYTGPTDNTYTRGDWYYWDEEDEAWTSGGEYNSYALTTDPTLRVEGDAADAKAVGDRFDEVAADIATIDKVSLNADILFNKGPSSTHVSSDVTYEPNDDGSIYVHGTADGLSYYNFYYNQSSLPAGLTPGKQYTVKYSSTNVKFDIWAYKSGTVYGDKVYYSDGTYTLPSDAEGLLIRLRVSDGTIVNETVRPVLYGDLFSSFVDADLEKKGQAADAKVVGDNFGEIASIGTLLLFKDGNTAPDERNGIAYSYNPSNGNYEISGELGTELSFSYYNIYNENHFPFGISKGDTIHFDIATTNAAIYLQLFLYRDGSLQPAINIRSSGDYAIPNNVDNNFLLRINVSGTLAGTTLNDTLWYKAYHKINQGDTIVNNNDYSIIENSYSVACSPVINTGIPYVLQPTGDSTDRTADIAAILTANGICLLGAGTFYVKNLTMPANTVLRGCGTGCTILRLSNDNDAAYAVGLNDYCSISDLTVYGGGSLDSVPATDGGKNGVTWQGTFISSSSGTGKFRGQISNLHICGFSGSGLYCSNTGTRVTQCINAANLHIYNCWAGININKSSEYSRFSNINVTWCHYGCINNGGNNVFSACSFSGNSIGFYIDDSQGQSPNNSHGAAVGCMFNHSGNNDGIAIKVDGADHGFVFSACNIFYGEIDITNANGINITGCNFGNIAPANPIAINVDGGGTVLLSNNIFAAPPTVTKTNNAIVIFSACYNYTGAAITS